MFKNLLVLILGLAAIVLVPTLMFAYSMLKPAEKVDVQLDLGDQSELIFFALGDQGTGNLRQWDVAHAMEAVAAKDGVDAVFLSGDSFYRHGVESVTDLQWRYKFENVYEEALARTPFFATLGNHDYYGDQLVLVIYDLEDQGSGRWQMPSRDYLKVFGRAGDKALVRVAFIDTGFWWRDPADTTRQLNRLLADAPAAVWTLVVTHTPLVSANTSDTPPGASALWQPLLATHSVDLVIAGHDHNMQLIDQSGWPLTAIVGVGGKYGTPLEKPEYQGLLFSGPGPGFSRLLVASNQLTLQYFDDSGVVLHEHRLEPDRQGEAP